MITETGYHGTKRASAEAIKREGFRIKEPSKNSNRRKFGKGAYFFREWPDGYLAASSWALQCFDEAEHPTVIKCPIAFFEGEAIDFESQPLKSRYERYLEKSRKRRCNKRDSTYAESRFCTRFLAELEALLEKMAISEGRPQVKVKVILGDINFKIFRGGGIEDRCAPAIVVRDASLIQHKEASILPCRRDRV